MGLLVTAKVNYDRCKNQHNTLSFSKMLKDNKLSQITSKISELQTNTTDKNSAEYKNAYAKLNAYETQYEVESSTIATELEVLEGQMKTLESYMSDSAKDATSFWCFG